MMTPQGPYEHKRTGKRTTWRVQVGTAGGKTRTFHFSTEQDAQRALDAIAACAEGPATGTAAISHRDPDGTLEWSSELLDKINAALVRQPGDRDLQALARLTASLSTARSKLVSHEKIEREFAALKTTVGEILMARKRGVRTPAGSVRSYRRDPAGEGPTTSTPPAPRTQPRRPSNG